MNRMKLYLADAIQLAHLRYTDRLGGTGVLESYYRLKTTKTKIDEWLGVMGIENICDGLGGGNAERVSDGRNECA